VKRAKTVPVVYRRVSQDPETQERIALHRSRLPSPEGDPDPAFSCCELEGDPVASRDERRRETR
jgi:hypothetical protein